VSFQSRLGREPWIAPFTDEVLAEQARRGRRRVVVISGFVADCLETLEEIRIRGREIWLQNGGEAFELVPAPNASAAWVKALVEIAGERLVRADRGL
jgi:ferrochelatase